MSLFDFVTGLFGGSSSKATNNTSVNTDVTTNVEVANVLDFQALGEGLGKLANAFQNDAQFQAATGLISKAADIKLAQTQGAATLAAQQAQAQVGLAKEYGFERYLLATSAIIGIAWFFWGRK